MKKVFCFLFALCLCLTSFAKDDEFVGRINSVNKMSGEDTKGNDVEILKINSTQSGQVFEGIMRIAMLLEGKNGKVAWGVTKREQPVGEVGSGEHKGTSATGAVTWTCEAGNEVLKRPKLKAYSVEYGYMKDDEFVVLDSEYKKVKSFDEFSDENKGALPLKMSTHVLYTVN